METYTAQQVADIVNQDDPKMNLRTVRYYTQIGMIPPLVLAGNKRVYTDHHIHHLRAIITLARTGETLAGIQEKLQSLSNEEIEKIGGQMSLHDPNRIIKHETIQISEDVVITVSPKISAELKQRMMDSVSQILRGEQ